MKRAAGRPRGSAGWPDLRPRRLPPELAAPLTNDPILKTVSRAAFALIMLLAVLLLWRGHNAPGGGFIAGLMVVSGLVLHRMANGESALWTEPVRLIPWGLALAFLTGLVPYLLGRPYLKTDYGYVTTALTGTFEWASAMLFDIGVFVAVVGAGLHICYALIDVAPAQRVPEDHEHPEGPAGGKE